ncbi:BZ3500_MvSof-1268-A1-R1_Chr6-2g08482 [Microbotryum saponariae]|uniref:BZ3500_MvSof-1268-A1-R1_Chr6-2g08482 protein n=1 Tax=Microbotryum saponariae TaxID=289078 RepID=A0A2X0LP53_9BASI|nr:BZ3500_MvSof-1268-A1-R1_Chr6-2g08482 [Microbotryum saponariae]SDA07759.1 BZ3501_MvSof-1269-A2-R1_Chr6-1g08196 [Microbotryum saponariae]
MTTRWSRGVLWLVASLVGTWRALWCVKVGIRGQEREGWAAQRELGRAQSASANKMIGRKGEPCDRDKVRLLSTTLSFNVARRGQPSYDRSTEEPHMNGHHQKRSHRAALTAEKAYYSSGTTTTTASHDHDDDSKGLHSKQQSKLAHALLRLPSIDEVGRWLEIIHPLGAALPLELEQMIHQQAYFYHLTRLDLSHLLQPQFMNDYIRKGSLIALSIPTRSKDDAQGDVLAIDGRGRLILNVSKHTYETLGLTGRKSRQLASATGQRFVIELPLSSPSNVCGKPGFERIKSRLGNWPTRSRTDLFAQLDGVASFERSGKEGGKRWDVLICFVGDDGSLQPIDFPPSLLEAGTRIKRCTANLTRSTIRTFLPPEDCLSPPFGSSAPKASVNQKRRKLMTPSGIPTKRFEERTLTLAKEVEERTRGMREWIGSVRLGDAGLRGLEEEEEEEEEEEGREEVDVTVLRWTGFFHPFAMKRILEALLRAQSSTIPKASTPSSTSPPTIFSLLTTLHHPFSHLNKWGKEPLVGTNKRPNGKRVKRGRGRGEEEEASSEAGGGVDLGEGGMRGVEIWFGGRKVGSEKDNEVGWSLWEWQ